MDEFNQLNYLTMQNTTPIKCTVYMLQILCHIMEKNSRCLFIDVCSSDASTGELMIEKSWFFPLMVKD